MYDRRPDFFRADDAPPTGRRVEGKVKWFNVAKGFGFVTLPDGTPDAFLPMAVLRRAGYGEAYEGAAIVCEVGAGAKGPLVVNVLNLDNSTAAPAGGGARAGAPRGPAQTMHGAVKWFESGKGYGFIAPEGGGKDIFVHITALRRSGVEALEPGQRVRVDVIEGRKGLEADHITLL
ncbi:MAG: cold shock domain-containing protein [Alphaproteobacteria bacterium]|nr:cold shock domain-containing protein [Alphaproteobacteria bacterium]